MKYFVEQSQGKLYYDVIMVFLPLELKSNRFEDRTDTIGLNRPCCSIFLSFLHSEVTLSTGHCPLGDFLLLRPPKEVYYYCNCRK